jgi:hypothetical protein
MKKENWAAWGRGLLPQSPSATLERWAELVLSEPLAAEIPPRDNPWAVGPMMSADEVMRRPPTNPDHVKWLEEFFDRVRALCVVHRIKPTQSGDINWTGLALHLIFTYEPKRKRETRIKLRHKAGAKLKRSTPQAKADRQALFELVETKLASNPNLSVNGLATNFAKTKALQKMLPARFRGKSADTLRKQIALARNEAKIERDWAMTLGELFDISEPSGLEEQHAGGAGQKS